MKTLQTQRGPLDIAESYYEVTSWSMQRCYDWLMLCDPNGAWELDDDCEEVWLSVWAFCEEILCESW